jgi:ABC-type multidrug transport system ATPase subunit
MPVIIKAEGLTKDFGEIKAVHNLSFSIEEGTVYGFLGQNGAGKSTTIRMLMTLVKPSGGSIEIFGKKLEQHTGSILQRIGAVIERPDLYKYLTAYENVTLFAKLSKTKPTHQSIMDILEKVGLAERAKSKIKTFSQGMKQRLGIATALIHNPDLIILDEPVNGLDPQGIADIRNLIIHLNEDLKKTLLVSSHLLTEMEMIATDLLIIHKGKKIAEGKKEDLLHPEAAEIELSVENISDAVEKIRNSKWATSLKGVEGAKLILEFQKTAIAGFNRDLVTMDISVTGLRSKHSLEDYFLQITGDAGKTEWPNPLLKT